MNSAIERLISLRVRDVMARDVVTVAANRTMSEAAETLRNYGISGVPVTDEMGRCVGVLSATDFVQDLLEIEGEQPHREITHELATHGPSGTIQVEEIAHDLVKRHMTPSVQTISENSTLIQAGRYMCEEHIHRLVVVNRQSRPVGIISSLDLVSALVHAVEE